MKNRIIGFADFVRRPSGTYLAVIWHGSPQQGNTVQAEFWLTHAIRERLAYLCPDYAWSYNPVTLNYLGGGELVVSYENYRRFKVSA